MFGVVIVFFFNDPATTEIYTLSLHDALPIYFSKLNNSEKSSIVSKIFGLFLNRGKNKNPQSYANIMIAGHKAAVATAAEQANQYYASIFDSPVLTTQKPGQAPNPSAAGPDSRSHLSSSQVLQAMATAKAKPKDSKKPATDFTDAVYTLEALNTITFADGTTGKDKFLQGILSARAKEILAQNAQNGKNGNFDSYLADQAGLYAAMADGIYKQNQLYLQANASLQTHQQEMFAQLAENLKNPETRAAAIARVAAYDSNAPESEKQQLQAAILQHLGKDAPEAIKAVKAYGKRRQLNSESWDNMMSNLDSAFSAVGNVAMYGANKFLEIMNRSTPAPLQTPGQSDAFKADQAYRDQLQRIKAGEQ